MASATTVSRRACQRAVAYLRDAGYFHCRRWWAPRGDARASTAPVVYFRPQLEKLEQLTLLVNYIYQANELRRGGPHRMAVGRYRSKRDCALLDEFRAARADYRPSLEDLRRFRWAFAQPDAQMAEEEAKYGVRETPKTGECSTTAIAPKQAELDDNFDFLAPAFEEGPFRQNGAMSHTSLTVIEDNSPNPNSDELGQQHFSSKAATQEVEVMFHNGCPAGRRTGQEDRATRLPAGRQGTSLPEAPHQSQAFDNHSTRPRKARFRDFRALIESEFPDAAGILSVLPGPVDNRACRKLLRMLRRGQVSQPARALLREYGRRAFPTPLDDDGWVPATAVDYLTNLDRMVQRCHFTAALELQHMPDEDPRVVELAALLATSR